MTAAGPRKFVVRLRWERGAYTSPAMPQHQAEEQAAELHEQVLACGDGHRFVQFTRYDGGTIRMRGREVIGVEAIPHLEREEIPSRLTPPVIPDELARESYLRDRYGIDDAAAGTQFLRQQAAQLHANGARR